MKRKLASSMEWVKLPRENSQESSYRIPYLQTRSDNAITHLWTQVTLVRGTVLADRVGMRKHMIVFDRLISDVQGSQHGMRAASRMYHSQVCGKVFENASLSSLTGCKCCRSTNGEHIEFRGKLKKKDLFLTMV
jgi:hypothetical protein